MIPLEQLNKSLTQYNENKFVEYKALIRRYIDAINNKLSFPNSEQITGWYVPNRADTCLKSVTVYKFD